MDISIGGTTAAVPLWVQPALTAAAIIVSATIAPLVMILQRNAKIRDARNFAMQTTKEMVCLVEIIQYENQIPELQLGNAFPKRALALMDEHLKAATVSDVASPVALGVMFQLRSMIHDLEWECAGQERTNIIKETQRAIWAAYAELGTALRMQPCTPEKLKAEIEETNPDWSKLIDGKTSPTSRADSPPTSQVPQLDSQFGVKA